MYIVTNEEKLSFDTMVFNRIGEGIDTIEITDGEINAIHHYYLQEQAKWQLDNLGVLKIYRPFMPFSQYLKELIELKRATQ